jgi:hypothetical protein
MSFSKKYSPFTQGESPSQWVNHLKIVNVRVNMTNEGSQYILYIDQNQKIHNSDQKIHNFRQRV